MAGPRIDVITFEVIRAAFYAIAREMKIAMMRTASSPIIHSGGDASAALFDGVPQMIAQGNDIPTMLGSMVISVKETLKGAGKLNPGDVVISNDSYLAGGNHNQDVQLVRPVFYEGEIIGYAVARGHWKDIGGAVPGSLTAAAIDIYAEGLRIPPVKICHGDVFDEDMVLLITTNSREPENRRMDIQAQYAAVVVGERRLIDLVRKYGKELVQACMAETLDYSERRMREAIRQIPDGVYKTEDFIELVDAPGWSREPARVRVAVTVSGDEMTYDYTGTDDQVIGGVNCPIAVTCNTSWYVTKVLTDPSIPINEGCYRPIKVVAPPGSLLNAQAPASTVVGNTETSHRLCDTLIAALTAALPDRVIAGSYGSAGVVNIGGEDPDRGRVAELRRSYVVMGGVHGGGMGARPQKDGINAIRSHIGNTGSQPVELVEMMSPALIDSWELVPDSAGAGRWRGGLASRCVYRMLFDTAWVTYATERAEFAAFGLSGGSPGAVANCRTQTDGRWNQHGGKTNALRLRAGDLVVAQPAGGGGYGDPLEREPERVLGDVLDGYISSEAARDQYGVVGDLAHGRVDLAATDQRRAELRKRRGPLPVIDWGKAHQAAAAKRSS